MRKKKKKWMKREIRCDESNLTRHFQSDLMDWITDWLTNLLAGSQIVKQMSFSFLARFWCVRLSDCTKLVSFVDWVMQLWHSWYARVLYSDCYSLFSVPLRHITIKVQYEHLLQHIPRTVKLGSHFPSTLHWPENLFSHINA